MFRHPPAGEKGVVDIRVCRLLGTGTPLLFGSHPTRVCVLTVYDNTGSGKLRKVERLRTAARNEDANPHWDQKFTVEVHDVSMAEIHFEVFNTTFAVDTLIGKCVVTCCNLERQVIDTALPLTGKRTVEEKQLQLRILAKNFGLSSGYDTSSGSLSLSSCTVGHPSTPASASPPPLRFGDSAQSVVPSSPISSVGAVSRAGYSQEPPSKYSGTTQGDVRSTRCAVRISLDDLGREWRELGQGGFGCVYKAYWEKTMCSVAVKKLRMERRGGVRMVERRRAFIDEIKRLQAFRFNNIVNFYGWSLDNDGALYMVTELCEGSFAEAARRRPVTQSEALRVLEQVAMALNFMHRLHNCAHLDVAARNVLESRAGDAKLGDFGLCATIGTPAPVMPVLWAPPETLRQKECDRTATVGRDVWGLGVLAWELMSGGAMPYEYLADGPSQQFQAAAVRRVLDGDTLRCPRGCCADVWEAAVLPCFESERMRPSAEEITQSVRRTLVAAPLGMPRFSSDASAELRAVVEQARLSCGNLADPSAYAGCYYDATTATIRRSAEWPQGGASSLIVLDEDEPVQAPAAVGPSCREQKKYSTDSGVFA
eukprot:TRINITY_DN1320_c0_g1_i8.p1 TRINITY_DN1320_c0_g1~~TRINITY_DN1320_c0_g1_i8.p1  ORF type:complete len:595 (+),score=198.08 TRINITY_DN1320_c0_g1_i8:139-1923(+)